MSLLSFIKSLVPNLDKDDILEDIRVTKNELEQIAIPSYAEGVTYFLTHKSTSKQTEDALQTFTRNYRTRLNRRSRNTVEEILFCLEAAVLNLKSTGDRIETLIEQTTISESITARKAILVRMAEQISYISRMSIDFLNLLYTFEQIEAGIEYSEVTVYQKKHVIPNIAMFAKLCEIYSFDNHEFKKKIESVPEMIIDKDSFEAASSIYKREAIDPIGGGMVAGFEMNPIYHFRLMIAEWQADRYKSYKEKKKLLEVKLLNLKIAKDGKRDPKLDREVNYYESLVEDLEYKMSKMEESVKDV